jgi:NAD+ diphosphatase
MQTASLSPYFIDRASHLREDGAWIHAQLRESGTRLVAVYQSAVLCVETATIRPCFLSPGNLLGESAPQAIFLGQIDGVNYFTLLIETSKAAQDLCDHHQASFQDYAKHSPAFDSDYRDLLSLACFTSYWHRRNQFCGSCGSTTTVDSAGHMRRCTSASCAQKYFPSMDPAVIVLIEHGEHCLLGRQAHWREGMYSTLAGFVEPGESAEDAVAREVNEEAGLQLEAIRYHSSEPWLFPNSLMLGFTAKATTLELHVDTNEIETAAWFTREQVKANPEMLPSKRSIAYRLIQEWLNR